MENKVTVESDMKSQVVKKKQDPSVPFVKDMEPYFYGRHITYLDVGAYRGAVLKALARSRIRVREAHLIEPNPKSFRMLKERMSEVASVRYIYCHNVAASDAEKTLRLRDEGGMTSVLPLSHKSAPPDGVEVSAVDVNAITLDDLAEQSGLAHISICKIDVEGHELEALRGAKRLLSCAAIDVIYVEAGIHPDNAHQAQYKDIESVLLEYGYRVFKIYEQTNEWIDDSPLLRRVNVAFMHEAFAEKNPHRVSRELFLSEQRIEKLTSQLESSKDDLGVSRRECKKAHDESAAITTKWKSERRKRKKLEEAIKELRSTAGAQLEALSKQVLNQERRLKKLSAISEKYDSLVPYARELERRYNELLHSSSWRVTRPARRVITKFRAAFSGITPSEEWRPMSQSPERGRGSTGKDANHTVRSMRRRMLDLGFLEAGKARLEEWATDTSHAHRARLAARELVVWHLNQGSHHHAMKAVEHLPGMMKEKRGDDEWRRARILESEAYARLGEDARARDVLNTLVEQNPHPDLYLAIANLESEPTERIRWINAALGILGLESIILEDGSGAPYDRMSSSVSEEEAIDGPLVSVIMPAYNSESSIETALRAMRLQTWKNFELIVVDDCSTDGTAEVVESASLSDSRIKLIRAPVNAGPYVARNMALGQAKGVFVTCHDADDWSHPRKLELQAKHLQENPLAVANLATQARATDHIVFNRRGNAGSFCYPNLSSLMFRRDSVVQELGFWDSVRFMADGEFHRRLEHEFGSNSIVVLEEALTSFQRSSDSSLTESSVFGYPGYLMGARREYFDASFQYQEEAESLYYDFPQTTRPFAVPAAMLPDRSQTQSRHYDVIIASDFRLAGGSTLSSIEEVQAQAAAGLRTGLVQMSRFDMDPGRRRMNRKLRRLVNSGAADVIVYGEEVSCDLLIIRYPPVLQNRQRYIPKVRTRNLKVIVNQPPMSDYGPESVLRYEIPTCAAWLQDLQGTSGVWHPIGPAVREALLTHHAEDLQAIDLSSDDWVNIINISQWRREQRPVKNKRPKIGRHARDHHVKWPGSREDILTVYPDSAAYDVYVMGGAEIPREIFGGSLPSNWEVVPFDGMSVRDYLSDLDVFVYYTHPDWVESFGRVIIEAMATGVPVILPPSYKGLFEDAATYAEPNEVLANVDALMADADMYEERVAHALDFVERKFGYRMHVERIREARSTQLPLASSDVGPNKDARHE